LKKEISKGKITKGEYWPLWVTAGHIHFYGFSFEFLFCWFNPKNRRKTLFPDHLSSFIAFGQFRKSHLPKHFHFDSKLTGIAG
jgi:hypothetical protein